MRKTFFCAAGLAALMGAQAASAAVVADFVGDYTEPAFPAGWAYQRNTANINDPATYTNLLHNGTLYDSNGSSGLPDPAPAAYTLVDGGGSVHPGMGATQSGSNGLNRYVILAYTIPAGVSGPGSLFDFSVTDASAGGGEGVNVLAGINDLDEVTNQIAQIPNGGSSSSPSIPLGSVSPGDVVYVAVGPDGAGPGNDDQYDGTTISYKIDVVPEPGALSLLGLAGAAVLARRRR